MATTLDELIAELFQNRPGISSTGVFSPETFFGDPTQETPPASAVSQPNVLDFLLQRGDEERTRTTGPSNTIGVDLARNLQDILDNPAAKAALAALPGPLGLVANVGGRLTADAVARNALGVPFSFGGFGDAPRALSQLGLTDRDFRIGGIATPKNQPIQFRDVERRGSPRAEDRAERQRVSERARVAGEAARRASRGPSNGGGGGFGKGQDPGGGTAGSPF